MKSWQRMDYPMIYKVEMLWVCTYIPSCYVHVSRENQRMLYSRKITLLCSVQGETIIGGLPCLYPCDVSPRSVSVLWACSLCVLHCSAWSSVQRGGHSSLPCQTCLPLPYETDDTLFFDQRPKRFDGPISCQVTLASAEKQSQNGMLSL